MTWRRDAQAGRQDAVKRRALQRLLELARSQEQGALDAVQEARLAREAVEAALGALEARDRREVEAALQRARDHAREARAVAWRRAEENSLTVKVRDAQWFMKQNLEALASRNPQAPARVVMWRNNMTPTEGAAYRAQQSYRRYEWAVRRVEGALGSDVGTNASNEDV